MEMKWLGFILVYFICIQDISKADESFGRSSSRQRPNRRQTTEDLFNEFSNLVNIGEGTVEYIDGNITLIVGNRGSGKTTLSYFLTEDNSKLYSTRNRKGEYIIEDEDDLIGSESAQPKTLFPELFFDDQTNSGYYDCPGFNLNHNVKEITATYFLQQVLQYAENIKLIFTLDYRSLNETSEDFTTFLDLSSMFLLNVEKYKKSIILIVTKVDSALEYEQVVSEIGDFFTTQKNPLEDQLKTTLDEQTKRTLQILDIFSFKANEQYKNIGLFRRPNQRGRLEDNDLLQKEKYVLYDLIDNLGYVWKDENDFGQLLSYETYDLIEKMHRKANEKANKNIEDIFQQIEKHQNFKSERSRDVMETITKDIIPSLNKLKQCLNFDTFQLTNIVNCISQHQQTVTALSREFYKAANHLDLLKILKLVAKDKIQIDEDDNLNFGTQIELKLFNNLIDFYFWKEAYLSIFKNFRSYPNQLNRTKIILPILDLNLNSMRQVLNEHYNINSDFTIPSNIDETSKARTFDKIAMELLKYPIIYDCQSPGNIIIKGNFIVTSKLDIRNKCPYEITKVTVFGFYKIFLDSIPAEIIGLNVAIVAQEIEQINFNLRWYIQNLPESTKFWILGYTDSIGPHGVTLYMKECNETLLDCYDNTFATTINNYKMYILENTTIQESQDFRFLKNLNRRHLSFADIHNTAGLIDEFIKLENQFYQLRDKMDLVPVYQLFLGRIEKYARFPVPEEDREEYRQVLKYLYTAVLGKICNIKNNNDNSLIIKIEPYLQTVTNNIRLFQERLDKAEVTKLIERYKDNFKEDINRKIDEANRYIEKYMTEDIERIFDEMNEDITRLVEEVMKLKNMQEDAEKYFTENHRKLKNIMTKKAILNSILIVSRFLSFFGFFGAVASAITEGVVGAINEFTPNGVNIDRQVPELPGSVHNLLDSSVKAFGRIEDSRIESLDNKLDVALYYLKTENEFSVSYLRLTDIKAGLRRVKYAISSLDEIDNLTRLYNEEMTALQQENHRPRRKISKRRIVKKINSGIEVARFSNNVFNEIRDDEDKLHYLADMVKKSKENIVDLERYEEKVYEFAKPTLKNLKSYITDLKEDASMQSEVGVLISKWEMQDVLKGIKFQFQEISTGFEAGSDLSISVEKLYDTVTRIMTLYERIQQYHDNSKFIDFTANIALAVNDHSSVSNTILNDALTNLDEIINSNFVLMQYERSINAFKQYIFPFAYMLDKFKVPHTIKTNDTRILVGDILKQLDVLKDDLSISRTTIETMDRYLENATFSSNFISSKPFYVWKNSQFKTVISKLLSGEEIILKADVMKNDHDKNAIKFNSIGINLKTIKESMQAELDNMLKHFSVRMTHMGNSYYRCDDKYYVIKGDSQDITYSFEMDSQGNFLKQNLVLTKLLAGNSMLSPYTMWKIELISESGISFDALDRFKNRVDLELVGTGYFVRKNSEVCTFNLDEYYEMANPFYDMTNVFSVTPN